MNLFQDLLLKMQNLAKALAKSKSLVPRLKPAAIQQSHREFKIQDMNCHHLQVVVKKMELKKAFSPIHEYCFIHFLLISNMPSLRDF